MTTPTGDPIVYSSTRPANGSWAAGITATVEARSNASGAVGIHWSRSDLGHGRGVALTADEFDGIARALGYTKAVAR